MQTEIISELGLFSSFLGRLIEASALYLQVKPKDFTEEITWAVLRSLLAVQLGQLAEAHQLVDQSLSQFPPHIDEKPFLATIYCFRANAAHARGDVKSAEADFTAATQLEGETLTSFVGTWYARHKLDLGDLLAARAIVVHGLTTAYQEEYSAEVTRFQALLARLALVEGTDPTAHLEAIRAWTSRTGEMEFIITAHLLAARHSLATGDNQAALAEAELGLLHAETCGYGLLRIELLVALARIRLAWPDPPAAIQAARLALDLATAPACGYAWGEADAAQAWGEAYASNNELKLAQRAFRRALAVRQRIRHPESPETEQWLASIS
jgi:tetratricopeptide (TPR) repeat protein